MAPIAIAEHVQRKYGQVLALSDVSFELQKGVTGLLGANGAGKTTLIGLLLGVLRPDGGKLEDERFPPDVKANELVRHFAEMRGCGRSPAGRWWSSRLRPRSR